jgi:hypothetical protein
MTLRLLEIKDNQDNRKVFQLVTLWIEEAELEELTDQENKVEEKEALVMLKTNSTATNTKSLNNKFLLLLKRFRQQLFNNKSPKNHKHSLYKSTTKIKV